MKATCEKPDCGGPAVAQARFGEVTVARACADHEPELLEFINQHMMASETGLAIRPVDQDGSKHGDGLKTDG